jgi:hypothetical protein
MFSSVDTLWLVDELPVRARAAIQHVRVHIHHDGRSTLGFFVRDLYITELKVMKSLQNVRSIQYDVSESDMANNNALIQALRNKGVLGLAARGVWEVRQGRGAGASRIGIGSMED